MRKISTFTIISLLLLTSVINPQSNEITNSNIIYISPLPNSRMNNQLTNIIIKTKEKINKQTVNSDYLIVTGSKSGSHAGKLILSDDGRTLVYNPFQKFELGEIVSVQLKSGLKDLYDKLIGECDFKFYIKKYNIDSQKESKKFMQKEIANTIKTTLSKSKVDYLDKMQKVNEQELNLPHDFPQLYVSVLSNSSPGYIFMSNFDSYSFDTTQTKLTQPYLMILNNRGVPFYYRRLNNLCTDFKLQPNGLITYYDIKVPIFYAMNNQFSVIDSFYCGNGYITDIHELQILPNGHYLIIGDDYETVDMSKIVAEGDSNATVLGIIIQELDQNKNVVFQWRSWDHYKITDATDDIDLTAPFIDYVHTNAIELDADGNILISNRHMDEITKINIQTGDIIWRLGGKNNQFTFTNDDVGFSHQHDIRRQLDGDITLFDDGNLHWSQLPSRAIEYKLDEDNKTIELVWQFKNSPAEYSNAMGNVQRLSNGNSILGWGTGSPAVTEVTSQGLKEYELSLPVNVYNYRAFRFTLDSSYFKPFVPALNFPPNGSLNPDTAITIEWTKNKFAQSFHLQVSDDSSFAHLIYDDSTLLDTSVTFDSLGDGIRYYWRVVSNNNTDSIGGYGGYSDTYNFTTILNAPSYLNVYSTSQANFITWDNNINNADSMIIERKGGADTINYKKITEISKTTGYFIDTKPDTIDVISNKYIYRIKATNKYSRSNYIYSAAIFWNVITDINSKNVIPKAYLLEQNFPNPFNPTTNIKYEIPKDGFVTLNIYDILGKEIATLVNEQKTGGSYEVQFNGGSLSSGIYYYKIHAGSFSAVKKMILLK